MNTNLIDRFSSTQGRRDQGPNRSFAKELAISRDGTSVKKIADLLAAGQGRKLENDMLLCLASLSELAPDLLKPHAGLLIGFLNSKNNRAIWGAMIALSNIAPIIRPLLYKNLPLILDAMDKGTVVTRDHGFVILLHLYEDINYQDDAFGLISEQLNSAPDNQLGQYAEKFIKIASTMHIATALEILENRSRELEKPSHKKRIASIIKKVRFEVRKKPRTVIFS